MRPIARIRIAPSVAPMIVPGNEPDVGICNTSFSKNPARIDPPTPSAIVIRQPLGSDLLPGTTAFASAPAMSPTRIHQRIIVLEGKTTCVVQGFQLRD